MEYPDRIQKLIKLKEYAANNVQGFPIEYSDIREIYDLNNYFRPENYETSIGCGSCQHRVKDRIFTWFENTGKAELENYQLENPDANETEN